MEGMIEKNEGWAKI